LNIKKLKKCGSAKMFILMLVLLTATLLPGHLAAANHTPTQFLDKEQTVNGPGFFTGKLVQVNGNVEGTTFACGQEVRVNGIINGDLFVAAQTISINGKINGNIYAAGQNLRIGSQSTGDVFAAGQRIDIAKEAVTGRDLFAGGQWISLDGTVQRDFRSGGSGVVINGPIGRDAKLAAENISLLSGALINGNLYYKSANQAHLAPRAKVSGSTEWQPIKTPSKQEYRAPASSLGSILLSIASALLIWFPVKIWRPDLWTEIARSISEQPLKTMGIGILAFLLTPPLIILLMITVIGLPLGIILGLAYGVTLYLSKIIVAVFVGSLLTKRFGWTERHKGVWPVLLGLAMLVLLMKVPALGILAWLLIVFTGLGGLILSKFTQPHNPCKL